jgi:hypothetical protein
VIDVLDGEIELVVVRLGIAAIFWSVTRDVDATSAVLVPI